MEGDMNISGSSGGSAGIRWTPTKNQIDLLENLYRQGVRTPSAEQIQHITNKLRAFGHIEGKNVFYWFQNHKARQRQKQKQENVALFNRFIHQTPPPPPRFPTNYLNVSCHKSFYMPPAPPSELSFRPNYQKLLVPGCYKKRPLPPPETISNTFYSKPCNFPIHEPVLSQEQTLSMQNNVNGKLFFNRNQETLDLFPLHPTGNLQEKGATIPSTSISAYSDTNYINGSGNFGHEQPFIDFFWLDDQCKNS